MKSRLQHLSAQIFLAITLIAIHPFGVTARDGQLPNIILIITDDQGYGDVGAHGNPVIKTPNLDKLHSESVRLTNYHVDPTCSPTRSALMTGRYSSRTGVWHTIQGRSIMAGDEITVAESLKKAGYSTAMFGKWHLGDNAPSRPQDQGFDRALYHGGGGVWQTPDYYGNDYFDDTYFENGAPRKFTGYCTDVWFREADSHIRKHVENSEDPFFIYLATNAPHGPFWVDEKYSQPYKDAGVPSPMSEFYGMITNIDENVGSLRQTLADLHITENTLFIFTTDNGTAAGWRGNAEGDTWRGFNDNMRGTKGSEYDGGHRVPFFAYWPAGGISGGRDINQLAAHIDIHPTIAEIAGQTVPDSADVDGTSLLRQLKGEVVPMDRTLVVHSQRIEFPKIWRKSSVMTQQWRLINGKELYDIQADPSQSSDIASAHPDVVENLTAHYKKWWDHIDDRFEDYVRINIGDPAEPEALITCHDWHPDPGSGVPWNQSHIENQPYHNGFWAINIVSDGKYEFILRQKPAQVKYLLTAEEAQVKIQGQVSRQDIPSGQTGARFVFDLKKGETSLRTTMRDPNGKFRGAYFVEVRKL